ncbi:MAG TPA: hypothetical protein VGI73_02065 [Solirubrobacterales bacterium]
MRRALVILLGLLLFAGAVAGCGGGSGESASAREAERVTVRWLQAMSRSDVRLACRLTDARYHQVDPEFPRWGPARICRERWLHSDNTPLGWKPKPGVLSIYGEAHPQVLEVVIEGERATVYVQGIGQRRPLMLRREHGRWLMHEAFSPV